VPKLQTECKNLLLCNHAESSLLAAGIVTVLSLAFLPLVFFQNTIPLRLDSANKKAP
jgi:hypothetical protein